MKDFESVSLNLKSVRKELGEFKQLLSSKSELAEKADILPFFRKHVHLAAFTGAFFPNSISADKLAYEYSIYGDFVADLVLKDSSRHQVLFVEFEDALKQIVFRKVKNRYTREWGQRLEHGYGQVIDWLWKLADMQKTDDFESKFGKHSRYQALLVIGRDSFNNELEKNRLDWRFDKTLVDSNSITCFSYDQLCEMYDRKLESIRLLST